MRGSLSPESRIKKVLIQLGCSETAFAKVAGFPQSSFSRIMTGEKDFTPEQANHLSEVFQEMFDLQAALDAPVAWENTEKVWTALVVRRVDRIARELGQEKLASKGIAKGMLVQSQQKLSRSSL